VETTGEMNWQLLIKIVSPSLAPLPPPPASPLPVPLYIAFRFSLWFAENRPTEPEGPTPFRCSGTPGFGRTGVRWDKGGSEGREREGFRSSSGGDAVSILFVHANYSSSVTLLEIEGTGTPPRRPAAPPPRSPANLRRSSRRVLAAHLPRPFRLFPSRLDLLPCPGELS